MGDAKNSLNEAADRALKEGPQEVTRRRRKTAVVSSLEDYARLRQRKGSLVEYLRKAPLRGIDLERAKDPPRNANL